jgi:hypothetical protein
LYLKFSVKIIVYEYIIVVSRDYGLKNDFFELQSNFKQAHIDADLANLHVNSCLRKKKLITILQI